MPKPAATCERLVEQIHADGARANTTDQLVVEAPLELRIGPKPLVVVMRTPGHDRELARGLMFTEGIIGANEALAAMVEPEPTVPEERGNVLDLGLAADTVTPQRSLLASSSCGVCGKQAIADLAQRVSVVRALLTLPAALIADLPKRLRRAQAVFATTGGLHAAGAFDGRGNLLAVREDIGRHNAVDKLIGWALGAGVHLSEAVLCVSGRIGFEIAQKAICAGFPIVVAVSAPSSLAVDLAERFRVTLCGFTRGGRFNVYSHGNRIV